MEVHTSSVSPEGKVTELYGDVRLVYFRRAWMASVSAS